MTNEEKFLQLVTTNTGLPIIPLVDTEVVAEDCYKWWLGTWGTSFVGHYYEAKERILIKEWDDEEDIAYALDPNYDELTEEEYTKLVESVLWKEAIIVNITV